MLDIVLENLPSSVAMRHSGGATFEGDDGRAAWSAFAAASRVSVDPRYVIDGHTFVALGAADADLLIFESVATASCVELSFAREIGLHTEEEDYLGTVICWLAVTCGPLPVASFDDVRILGHGGLGERDGGDAAELVGDAERWRVALEASDLFCRCWTAGTNPFRLGLYDR